MKKLMTILSTLIISYSIVPLTVSCGNKKIKKEPIDINSITSEMIVNHKKEYQQPDGTKITADQLVSQDETYIKQIIATNIISIISTKITGLKELALEEPNLLTKDIDAAEHKNILICGLFFTPNGPNSKSAISIETKTSEITENNKNFETIITVNKWDEIKNSISNFLTSTIESLKEHLKKPDKELKELVKNMYKNLTDENAEKMITKQKQTLKIYQSLKLDSIKEMYDLIKGESKTITINLTKKSS